MNAAPCSRTFNAWAICSVTLLDVLNLEMIDSSVRFYRTSSITASWPAISTVSPGPCVRTARASGDTYDTVPREGSASSSPTILKLCSWPSFLRRVTVVPKAT